MNFIFSYHFLKKKMDQEWIKLPEFRVTQNKRKIYKAKCLKCGRIYKSHRYMKNHCKRCKGNPNLNQIEINFPIIPEENYNFTLFQENLINMFVSGNISISKIESKYFKQMFIDQGVKEELIPNSENFRELIIEYSNLKHDENLQLFENKFVSLVIDGTTSWNRSMYQISLYYPGILRHLLLQQIDNPTGNNLKIIIENICTKLEERNIAVVGVTTDNGANLVKCFKEIEKDVILNKFDFPIIRFSCAAHTGQLIINDLSKSNETFKSTISKIFILRFSFPKKM